jgi:hypothetical protein
MSKVILFDSGGALLSISPAFGARSPEETDQELCERIAVADAPSGADWAIFDLPIDDAAVQTRFPNIAWPPLPLDPVPGQVDAAQALAVLDEDGFLDDVEAIIASQPRTVQHFWSRASVFRRDDPTLNQLAAALGFADRLDDMFRRAATKTAAG